MPDRAPHREERRCLTRWAAMLDDHSRRVSFIDAIEGTLRGAEAALAGFGKAVGPILSTTQSAMHRGLYSGDRRHARRCPTCNPAGFPKPLAIDGHEYKRRRRRRGRRWVARIAREIGEGSA